MDTTQETTTKEPVAQTSSTKFCQHCGKPIAKEAVICPLCGCQVELIKSEQQAAPQVVINNSNSSVNTNTNTNIVGGGMRRSKNKWVALLLCFFLGFFGGHKFYEGKIGMGILYIFTGGLFGIGAIVDFIVILCKPNPYYV